MCTFSSTMVNILLGKYVHKSISPQISLLYSKTGVCKGKSIFLIFDPKHRLKVLVRTASPRSF